MNKNLLTLGLLGALGLISFLIFSSSTFEIKNNLNNQVEKKDDKKINLKPAEKVQVFVFHSNNRCYACVTMGKYTEASVKESFQKEIQEEKVEFREINIDLPENKEVAQKFKAAGSSVFINSIIDGEDNIEEEIKLWRLLSNKQAFSDYLIKKVKEKLE